MKKTNPSSFFPVLPFSNARGGRRKIIGELFSRCHRPAGIAAARLARARKP
jgi:hypothetical protein